MLIRVADRGAAYPLRIDPLIQQGGKLTGAGATGTGRFGYSVALSADGNTALIGGRYGTTTPGRRGCSLAPARPGPSRAKTRRHGPHGAANSATSEKANSASVALSADGNTALIGGPGDNGGTGAAWVFTRSGSTWTQQGAKLTGAGETGDGRFGDKRGALRRRQHRADRRAGTTTATRGAAWVFTRSGSTWTQQGAKLTGTRRDRRQAVRLAASRCPQTEHGADRRARTTTATPGAAWVFTRSGATWTQQGAKLTGTRRDRRRRVRLQRRAVRRRQHRADRRPGRQRQRRRGVGVHALGRDLDASRAKSSPAPARPAKAGSAPASRSPPTATRR